MLNFLKSVEGIKEYFKKPQVIALLVGLLFLGNAFFAEQQAVQYVTGVTAGIKSAYNIFSTINWITGIIFASFTVFLVASSSKRSARAYGVLAVCVTLWSFATGLYYSVEEPRLLLFLNQFSHYIGAMVGVAFFYFALIFPEERKPAPWILPTLVLIELLLIYPYHFTHLIVKHTFIVQGLGLDRGWEFGPLGFIFHLNFAPAFTAGIFILYQKYLRSSDPFTRKQLRSIVFATSIGSLPAVALNVILPIFGEFYYTWLGPAFSISWVVATIYAIVRYRALNVKLIVAEIAILLMGTILFVNIFFTKAATLSILGRLGVFTAFAVVGVFFIKSIVKSEKQRDELARVTSELKDLNRILENDVEARTKELAAETAHVETIIENLTSGLIEYDNNFNILRLNREAEQMLGIKRSDVVGKHISPVSKDTPSSDPLVAITYPGLAAQSRRISTSASGVEASVQEVVIKQPAEKEVQVITAPLIGGDGNETGFIKVLRDVTRERLLARSKSEFITIAAHQLRTPLSIIKWTLSVLLEGDKGALPETQQEPLTRAYATNEKMIGLINDLLDVARIEDGRFGYKFETAHIDRLIESVMSEYNTLTKEKRISYSFKKPTSGAVPFMFDATRLSLALHGLLDNAFNYTPKGGSITVELDFTREHAIIIVKDTGIGIPKNQINRLFTKFFRAQNAIQATPEGSGLGLFIVKNIIARHGGTISVQSEENKGATFTIKLPLNSSLIPNVEESVDLPHDSVARAYNG